MEREITEKEYNEAQNIISLYQKQLRKKIEDKIPEINLRLEEYFKKTYIKKFRTYLDNEWGDYVLEIKSLNPIFDEDYSGNFDRDLEKISKEFGIQISFESDNYGK